MRYKALSGEGGAPPLGPPLHRLASRVGLGSGAILLIRMAEVSPEDADVYYREARDIFRELKESGRIAPTDLQYLTALEEIVPD